jgi:hypothetical protein
VGYWQAYEVWNDPETLQRLRFEWQSLRQSDTSLFFADGF